MLEALIKVLAGILRLTATFSELGHISSDKYVRLCFGKLLRFNRPMRGMGHI